MEYYFPLITVFLSGLFALLVAVVTTLLATRKDTRTYRRERDRRRYENTEALYVDTIAILEKCIRDTERLEDYSELSDELPRLNARLELASTREIVGQYEVVGDVMSEWSTEYRRGAPKRVGDTGMAIISSHDPPHQTKAKGVYPKLNAEIVKLANLMKEHLKSIDV